MTALEIFRAVYDAAARETPADYKGRWDRAFRAATMHARRQAFEEARIGASMVIATWRGLFQAGGFAPNDCVREARERIEATIDILRKTP